MDILAIQRANLVKLLHVVNVTAMEMWIQTQWEIVTQKLVNVLNAYTILMDFNVRNVWRDIMAAL